MPVYSKMSHAPTPPTHCFRISATSSTGHAVLGGVRHTFLAVFWYGFWYVFDPLLHLGVVGLAGPLPLVGGLRGTPRLILEALLACL